MALDDEPRSDAEITAYTVGAPEILNSTITLVDYDPAWPLLYERERERISRALGDRALLIEHVGSTAIPGLAAKPRIDICLAVPDSGDEDGYRQPLEAAGYVLRVREPEWQEHRLFKGPDTDINLHLFTLGSAEIERMLRFRDHLRRDEVDRRLYGQSRRDLAGRVWKYAQHYADAKSLIVEEILARASG